MQNSNILKMKHDLADNILPTDSSCLEIRLEKGDLIYPSWSLDSFFNSDELQSLCSHKPKGLWNQTISFEELAGKGAKQLTFNQIELEKAAEYAAEDADVTLQLHLALWPQLSENPGLVKVLQDIEMPLLPVLGALRELGELAQ